MLWNLVLTPYGRLLLVLGSIMIALIYNGHFPAVTEFAQDLFRETELTIEDLIRIHS